MLTAASQFTPRARSLQTQYAAATRAIAVFNTAGIRQPQQTRGFRIWLSKSDPELHRGFRKFLRESRQNHIDQTNGQSYWGQRSSAEDARHATERMMKRISQIPTVDAGCAKEAGADKQPTSTNKDGLRPGQNIEDVDRGVMDHLLFGKDEEQIVSNSHSKKKKKARSAKSVFVPHSSYGSLERDDFVIDPITNRKVAKHPAPNTPKDGVDTPVKTSKEDGIHYFEDLKPQYEDLDRYRSVVVDEIAARFFESEKAPYSDLDKYKPVIDDVTSSQKDSQPKHDDLGEYKAYGHNEPDGKPVPTAEELSKNYDPAELAKYGPVKWNEPDGKPTPTTDPRAAENCTKDYDPVELAKYGPVKWNEPDGNSTPYVDPRVAEGLSKDYDPEELAQYNKPVYCNEPHGQPLPSQDERVAEGLTKDYPDLDKYSHGYRWNEPDGKPTSNADPRIAESLTKNYTDLDKYNRAFRWNEPDGKPMPSADPQILEEATKNYNDVAEYSRAYEYNEPDGNPTPTAEELRRNYTDLDKYRPVWYKEPHGQPVIQSNTVQQDLKTSGQDQESKNIESSNYRKTLDSLMKRHQAASDAIDREASLAVKSAKAKVQEDGTAASAGPTMTGNYARDFPEDFKKSWAETLFKFEDRVQTETPSMDGGLEGAFGQPSPSQIETALDRQSNVKAPVTEEVGKLAHTDSYSKEAQGLGSCDDGKISDRPTASSTSDMSGEPTLYKILAYDSTMQEINIAETSSYVPDTASALTPAEALARLSNPSRFFSHFAPLEAEGYEIVSGTGDVLIFRKVRSTSTMQTEEVPYEPRQSSTAAEPQAPETLVNPIDMTGRAKISPASANFTSPTGYVNYDGISGTEANNLPPPPPRIKYNIDVQREEPVFSGSKSTSYDGQRTKKKSMGKRLIVGGVWVASFSYGLGVISEYLTKG